MAANPPDDASTEALAARLEAAETTMRRQARELVELRAQVPDDTFADQLRQALVRMGAAGQVAAPVDHNDLLDLIVGTAAHVIAAEAASLYLLDRATNELVFVVALGESAAKARQFRVPVGTGIAGWVAETGEPALIQHDRVLDGQRRRYEALWLPLSEDGAEVTMLLGALVYKDRIW